MQPIGERPTGELALEWAGGAMPADATGETEGAARPTTAADRAAAREAGEAADAALVRNAAASIGALSDPMMLQQVVQTWLRDLGLEVRESGAEAASDRAALEGERRLAALDASRVAADRAASEGFIAQVCGYIGSGLALVAGAVGAAFSGGASLVAAVAAVVLIAGALTTQILTDTNVVGAGDREAAGWTAFGMSVAATVCSFGASAGGAAASGASAGAKVAVEAGATAARAGAEAASSAARAAAEVAKTAARITLDALSYASSAVQTVEGGAEIASAASTHEAAMRRADGAAAGATHDDAFARMDADVDAARALMATFARMTAALSQVRDAAEESRRAARLRA